MIKPLIAIVATIVAIIVAYTYVNSINVPAEPPVFVMNARTSFEGRKLAEEAARLETAIAPRYTLSIAKFFQTPEENRYCVTTTSIITDGNFQLACKYKKEDNKIGNAYKVQFHMTANANIDKIMSCEPRQMEKNGYSQTCLGISKKITSIVVVTYTYKVG